MTGLTQIRTLISIYPSWTRDIPAAPAAGLGQRIIVPGRTDPSGLHAASR